MNNTPRSPDLLMWAGTRRIAWLEAALIIAAGLWVYAPVFRGARLWDDDTEIFANAAVRAPAGIIAAWTAPVGPDYYPLKGAIEWIQWRLWGDAVIGYHLSSIGLHLLSALLLWRLLHRLGCAWPWMGGLWFAVHPMAVPSVAWMAELKNTLSLPLLLASCLAYLAFDERRRPGRLCAAFACFGAALLCKASVVMFPAVLLLYAWWRHGRIRRSDLAASAPFFGLALVLGAVALEFQRTRAIAGLVLPLGSVLVQTAGAGHALLFYLMRSVVPAGLQPVYPAWPLEPLTLGRFLPWLALGALAAGLWLQRRAWGRPALFGLGWFALNLAPVLGYIPLSYFRIAPVADHLAYVALVGVVGLAAGGLGALAARGSPAVRVALLVGGATVAALFAVTARSYAAAYRDSLHLWTYATSRDPESWLAQNNLGSAWLQAGRPAEALAPLEVARHLRPDTAEVLVNLGDALLRLQRAPEAVACGEEAVRLEPDFASAHYNLANALVQLGRLREAILEYRASVRLEPAAPEMRYNLGNALAAAGALDEAAEQYGTDIRLEPDRAEARINLATVLLQSGRLTESAAQFEAATRLQPGSPDAQYGLADALFGLGQTAASIPHYEAALRLRPGDAGIRASLEQARTRLER
jgi:tetratricopeptide (TPR) repeat protein